MKEKRLSIQINKSAGEVFEYVTDPRNTPHWVKSISVEVTSEWPVKLGTVYRNKGDNNNWTEYTVTQFEKDKSFVLTKNDQSYNVKYTLTPINENTTELEYYEWMDQGELEEPFTQEVLVLLKDLIEK